MQADLEKLRLLLSHVIPGATIKEVLKFALKESIKKRDIMRETKTRNTQREVTSQQASMKKNVSKQSSATDRRNQDVNPALTKRPAQPAPESDQMPQANVVVGTVNKIQKSDLLKNARAWQAGAFVGTRADQTGIRIPISTTIKRLVWTKSQGQCCYRYLGLRCSSRFQLQIDHVVSIAKGGSSDVSNLQLLCRQHNQLKGLL